jgi:hypothetical protein
VAWCRNLIEPTTQKRKGRRQVVKLLFFNGDPIDNSRTRRRRRRRRRSLSYGFGGGDILRFLDFA